LKQLDVVVPQDEIDAESETLPNTRAFMRAMADPEKQIDTQLRQSLRELFRSMNRHNEDDI